MRCFIIYNIFFLKIGYLKNIPQFNSNKIDVLVFNFVNKLIRELKNG